MKDFKHYKLSDLYFIDSGISISKDQGGFGYPFLSFKTVFNNYFLPPILQDYMNTTETQQKKYSIKQGDVFLTRTSETNDELAMSSIALKDYPTATYSGFLKRLRPKNNGVVYEKYIAFYLRNNFFRKTINNYTSLTLRASFNEELFSYLSIYLPPYQTQKTIGDLLFLFENKISLNNSIISKLEEMAKTIYEYWFLQFDFPNSEGKPYASSGGTMKYSKELGREIPIDWEVTTLGSLLERNSSAFDYSSTQPTIDLSVMPQGSIMLNQLNSSDNFATNLFEMKEGDILFGSIRPYLKKAGIAPCNGVYAGTVYSYRPKNEDDFNFAIITMCRNSFFDYAVQISQGTKMPVVKSENLMDYKLAYNPKISKQFNQTIQLKKIICSKAQENQKLAQLRDWLLPMLMNGQVRVE